MQRARRRRGRGRSLPSRRAAQSGRFPRRTPTEGVLRSIARARGTLLGRARRDQAVARGLVEGAIMSKVRSSSPVPRRRRLGSKTRVATALLDASAIMVPAVASAHTTEICWRDSGGVTTFYAGSYHYPEEGPSPVGSIILDGFAYPFSGYVLTAQLPDDVQCWTCPGSTPAVVHYQTFTSGFAGGPHTISFDSSTAVQSPWCSVPEQTFGGGSCADADFDEILQRRRLLPARRRQRRRPRRPLRRLGQLPARLQHDAGGRQRQRPGRRLRGRGLRQRPRPGRGAVRRRQHRRRRRVLGDLHHRGPGRRRRRRGRQPGRVPRLRRRRRRRRRRYGRRLRRVPD